MAGLLRGGYVVLRSVGLVPALKGASTLVLRIARGREGAVNSIPDR